MKGFLQGSDLFSRKVFVFELAYIAKILRGMHINLTATGIG